MTRPARHWVRLVAMNAAAALLVAVAFNGVTLETPWRSALEIFGVAFLFASCIGPLCALTMPGLSRLVLYRFPFPFNWAVLVAAMVGFGIAGSLVAIGILRAVGYIATSHLMWLWFARSVKVSIIVTLIFGIFATVVETMRARLDETTVALRTKERDEARARRLAAEAQLASLEARVNPHFLFNTLNSIAALVHDDPPAAERMTAQLASLMRSSLESGSAPLVPLDEELRVVRTYLEIEQVRFGERLRYRFDIDESARQALVPRLSLQTLAENSVKFAVAPRREGASLAVRAAAANGYVRLEIEDDGPGFDGSMLPDGHGLALLRARLAMTFGDAAVLAIDSRPGRTTVTMDLPNGSS